MSKTIGKVLEVYIPEEYKNGNMLDIMDRSKVEFKIMTDIGIEKIILEQNEFNCKIMKNDIVVITKQTISDVDSINIELYDGE